MRGDDDNTRQVVIQLSKWKVAQTKLLPLLVACRDDDAVIRVVSAEKHTRRKRCICTCL